MWPYFPSYCNTGTMIERGEDRKSIYKALAIELSCLTIDDPHSGQNEPNTENFNDAD